jgi:hypothetical protein
MNKCERDQEIGERGQSVGCHMKVHNFRSPKIAVPVRDEIGRE